MNNGVIKHETLMGAIIGTAPHLVQWFLEFLNKEEYTVEELNTLLRYRVIQLSTETTEVRQYLCRSPDTYMWLHYFCLHVIPFISGCLANRFTSPTQFLQLMAG